MDKINKSRHFRRVENEAGERVRVTPRPQITSDGRADRFSSLSRPFCPLFCERLLVLHTVGQFARFAKFSGLYPQKNAVITSLFPWDKAISRNMENQKLHSKEKHKFALYAPDHVIELARKWYEEDNCASLSEFICKAIEFYSGFVSNKANPNIFPEL